jgi:Holliday junction resolvasome RuvABC DNA-binding subunit
VNVTASAATTADGSAERSAHVGATEAAGELGAHVGATNRAATRTGRAANAFDATVTRTQARDAVVALGWKPHIAKAAIRDACAAIGDLVPVEVLIREALQRCLKPRHG